MLVQATAANDQEAATRAQAMLDQVHKEMAALPKG